MKAYKTEFVNLSVIISSSRSSSLIFPYFFAPSLSESAVSEGLIKLLKSSHPEMTILYT